jgi:O-antigen/teichoic acid export membrane protein
MLVLVQLQEIGNATWAPLIELHARGLHQAFRDRLLQLSSTITTAGIILLVPVAILNGQFIALWVGPASYAGMIVTALACANVWMWSISSLWGWVVFGSGHIAKWTPYAVAFGVVNVCVSVGATRLAGIYGPLLGTGIAFALVTSWAMPRVVNQVFGVPPRELYGAVLRPFAWGLPYAAAVYVAVTAAGPLSGAGIAVAGGSSVAAGFASWWFLGLSSADREVWVAQTRSALAPVF